MFQFHEGPIKTMISFASSAIVSRCFNSMKVRLKPFARVCKYAAELFQFHEGPIKTNLLVLMAHTTICFNSMKVRLKLV